MEEVAHQVYLSLGSNLGNRMENLYSAIRKLHAAVGEIEQISSIYETKSWGYESENNYFNCCVRVTTSLTPQQLLEETKRIERSMGRIKTPDYSDRIVDIDILFYEMLVIKDELLEIPHPHIENRAFVLLPLAEIAPQLCHSKHFLTIEQLSLKYIHTEDVECYQRVEKTKIIN